MNVREKFEELQRKYPEKFGHIVIKPKKSLKEQWGDENCDNFLKSLSNAFNAVNENKINIDESNKDT